MCNPFESRGHSSGLGCTCRYPVAGGRPCRAWEPQGVGGSNGHNSLSVRSPVHNATGDLWRGPVSAVVIQGNAHDMALPPPCGAVFRDSAAGVTSARGTRYPGDYLITASITAKTPAHVRLFFRFSERARSSYSSGGTHA